MKISRRNFNLFTRRKGGRLFLDRNVAGSKMVNIQQSIFSTVRRNYNRKTTTELRIEGETTTNNERQILEVIEKCYNELYASVDNLQENDVDEFIEHLKIPKLTDEDRDRMEGPLSNEECKKALETFLNNKAPGEDGFTVEFY